MDMRAGAFGDGEPVRHFILAVRLANGDVDSSRTRSPTSCHQMSRDAKYATGIA